MKDTILAACGGECSGLGMVAEFGDIIGDLQKKQSERSGVTIPANSNQQHPEQE